MPISSRNISRKLGKSKSAQSTESIVKNLKLQHAEDLAAANVEHAKKITSLEKEVEQCRAEIDTLMELDERSDMLTPLPSPSESLKFVKNIPAGRKARKQGAPGLGGKNVVNLIADMKMQHRKDLAKAADIYAKKLNMLQKEVKKERTEMETLKAEQKDFRTYRIKMEALEASPIKGDGEWGCGRSGVNVKTGMAENDKENISQKRALSQSVRSSNVKIHGKDMFQPKEKTNRSHEVTATSNRTLLQHHQGGDMKKSCASTNACYLRDRYERLFLEEYQLEKDLELEKAIAFGDEVVNEAVKDDGIDEICKDLIVFMADVRNKSLGTVL